MGIDVWEVLDAADTKPFGFMRFTPGPGLGGHCIPIDPFYLSWKAREYGVATRFIELAGEINHHAPEYVVEKLTGPSTTAARRSRARRSCPRPGLQEGHRRPAREPGLRDHRAAPARRRGQLPRPPHPDRPEHALLARPPGPRPTSPTASPPPTPSSSSPTTPPSTTPSSRASNLIIDPRGVYREPHPNVVKA